VRDRAYRVAEIYELLSAAGLRLAAFLPPIAYDPLHAMSDPLLRARVGRLSEAQRHAFAELFHCGPMKHIFFAVPAGRAERTVASPDDLDLVPSTIRELPKDLRPGVTFGLRGLVPEELRDLEVAITCAIDGQRSVREIFAYLASSRSTAASDEAYLDAWKRVYRALNGRHILVLTRHPIFSHTTP
jgi:hypothetical protein